MRNIFALTFGGFLCLGILCLFSHLRQQLSEPSPAAAAARQITLFATVTPAFSRLPAGDTAPAKPVPAAIAIIIDDLGEQWQMGKRTIDLPGEVTLAILPFSTYSSRLAELAVQRGREVMLHAPMEPLSHPAWRGGLKLGMTEVELRGELEKMLEALPQVRGVNFRGRGQEW